MRSNLKRLGFAALLGCLGLNALPAGALEPSNPRALPEAHAVLDYLGSLHTRTDKRLLSAQQLGDAAAGIQGYQTYVVGLFNKVGKWPALISADYGYPDVIEPSTVKSLNGLLINHWKAGGLVSVSVHMGSPWGGDVRSQKRGAVSELISGASAARTAWITDLDTIAVGLKELQEAGVVVLFRPLHEMNGEWFWWHMDSASSYITLWRQMYDYLTKTKGLNNLLWVFSPNGTGQSGISYYPGDDYCDVTGLDLYSASIASRDYAALVGKGKPFALTEWAPSMGDYDGTFNLENMLADLKRNMPATRWVLFWSGWKGAKMSLVEQAYVSAYLNDPWVITRDAVNWRSSTQAASPVVTNAPPQAKGDSRHPATADHLANRLGEMIAIPAGSFLMGNNGREGFEGPEEFPQHSVTLPTYQIGKYEVTRGEFRKFIEAGGYTNLSYWSAAGWKWKESDVIDYAGMHGAVTHTVRPNAKAKRNEPEHWAPEQEWKGHGFGHPRFVQTDNHPVVGVTYYEAEAYCKWAGGRLPTEAEWEKAARWDEKKQHANIWPWGDTWDPEKCNNPEDHNPVAGGYKVNQSAPVGSYPAGASPYGCLDMVGNAYEWVADQAKSYPGNPKPFDHAGYHFVKGGCWDDGPFSVRCAYRGWYLPPSSSGTGPGDSDYMGFRVAR